MIRPLLFALLLTAPTAASAAVAELVCDADTQITFVSRWIQRSSVVIKGSANLELPWTGRETITSGHEIRKTLATAPDSSELRDAIYFMAYRSANSPTLYIDRNLILGRESDGLVILSEPFTLLHCRSR